MITFLGLGLSTSSAITFIETAFDMTAVRSRSTAKNITSSTEPRVSDKTGIAGVNNFTHTLAHPYPRSTDTRGFFFFKEVLGTPPHG